MKVRGLMIREVVTMAENATIQETLTILYERHVGSVVITDEEENVRAYLLNGMRLELWQQRSRLTQLYESNDKKCRDHMGRSLLC